MFDVIRPPEAVSKMPNSTPPQAASERQKAGSRDRSLNVSLITIAIAPQTPESLLKKASAHRAPASAVTDRDRRATTATAPSCNAAGSASPRTVVAASRPVPELKTAATSPIASGHEPLIRL